MLEVDLDDATPLYLQVVQGLQRAIADGRVPVGRRLPSVRQLAGDLGINLNTVARAYRQLEEQGLLRVRHGRGAVVVHDHVDGDDRASRADLRRALAQAFAEARLAGLGQADIESEVRAELTAQKRSRPPSATKQRRRR